MHWSQWIVALLGAGVGAAILKAIEEIFRRRRSNAEADSITEKTRLEQAQNLQAFTEKLMQTTAALSTDKQNLLTENGRLNAELAMERASKAILTDNLEHTLREVTQMKFRLNEIEAQITQRLNGSPSKA